MKFKLIWCMAVLLTLCSHNVVYGQDEEVISENVENNIVINDDTEELSTNDQDVEPILTDEETVSPETDKTPESFEDLPAADPIPQIASDTGRSIQKKGDYTYDNGYNNNDFGDIVYGNLDLNNNQDGYNWEDPNNRVAPPNVRLNRGDASGAGYTITPLRLAQIRRNFLYWFHDTGPEYNQQGDYIKDIHASMPQVHKNLDFQLPFFGFRFNYTRVSMNGYLEFSDPPEHYTYPLVFPTKDWPARNDPSFIGIFFSKTRIGRIRPSDIDQRNPGVYFRLERDLMQRIDRVAVEMSERVMWDIREGVVGADTFVPKHVAITTWKNMSFAGGIDNSLFRTNTFQLVLATDEVYTYAIFNYADITWSAHTEAGGDTTGGEGGVPAYIGFNAGNGTQAYEYKPYSQASVLRDLTGRGWANGFPGRHIFRIDERIMLGTCNKDIDAAHLPLVFAPESGNMLGGTVVNITGPCFSPEERIVCRFDTEAVVGHYVDRNRAICVQPFLMAQGYIRFEISIGVDRFKWRGRYFVETPATATDRIFFEDESVHERNPNEFRITWNRYNLTTNLNAAITISLWGYRESTIRPELQYIDMLETGRTNEGYYIIAPQNYRNRDNRATNDMQFGFIKINLTNPEHFSGLAISPVLWSKPIPLAWYFGPQWERIHGRNWPRALCDNWFLTDRFLRNFAAEIPLCPCTLDHALYDKGRFLPDFECDKDSNPTCLHHKGAIHCVRSGTPSVQGSEQQCCYDRNGFLMMSYDQRWGSRPRRNHNLGTMPWNEANKVPTLSTWFHDVRPYYSCCMWQSEQAVGCETFRFERRPTQDCIAYQSPGVASIFGDPHVVTFDNLQYTFNGMGEFVLVRGNNGRERIDVQGRFEQVPRNVYGPVMATQLTSIAARGNTSTIIEVRLRPQHAQWRYRLDVFADGRRIYFDRQSLKFQHFHGVTVYTPTYILNQSEVVIMFSSGVGVEVIENAGFMSARVYMPWSFINKTRGLFGNWSFDMQNDLTLPDGNIRQVNLNNFESIHREFGLNWMLSDRNTDNVGAAMFTREFGRTASHFSNVSFIPNFIREPRDFLPANRTHDVITATDLCGESYQCRYDFGMSLSRDMAHFTKNYYTSAVNIRTKNEERIISCGILETPRFGRKLSFEFTPGSEVTFQCDEGFVLIGDSRRTCTEHGRWSTPEYGYTECLRNVFYYRRNAWITTGIVLAVMVPILMCIVCGVYCFRKKQLKKNPNWVMQVPHSRSGSRATLRNLNSDGSEMDDAGESLKKSRSYDKVYRTHEPLEGKPNTEFPEKKWDLDDDITSSEGSEFRDSKIARDIDYIKNGEKPKQQGRRSLRLGNEYRPIEEEAPNYQPPVSPMSESQYSPSFTGIDRNSYESQNPNNKTPGGVRVLPGVSTQVNNDNQFFGGATSPQPPAQDVGLPSKFNSRSTDV